MLMGLGLALSALASARTPHHEGTTILLVIYGYTFVVWLAILVGIHVFGPEGWIVKRRRRLKGGQEYLGPGPLLDSDLEELVALLALFRDAKHPQILSE